MLPIVPIVPAVGGAKSACDVLPAGNRHVINWTFVYVSYATFRLERDLNKMADIIFI
jgi:hypothetical protein